MSTDVVEERRVWTSRHGGSCWEPSQAGGYFRLDYRDSNGKRHQPSVGRDEKRALVRLAEVEAELASALGERGRQTVSELMYEFIAQARKDGSYTKKHEEA